MVTQAPGGDTLRQRLPLYLLIASLPFSDFLQTGVVAFNAAPIMGDLGVSPEEYSLVATLYALVAIGLIFNHRWLVEHIGWRWVLRISCTAFALGAVACASSEGLQGFIAGRLVMSVGCASFFTVGRVLVNWIPPSPRRFVGIKFFASGVAWGGVAGPLLASVALSAQNWRYAFLALVIPAAVIAILSELVLPPHERPATLTPFDARGLFMLASGSALLLFAIQRTAFDFFSYPQTLLVCTALAVPVIALSIFIVGRRELPLIRLRELSQRRYLVGLAAFGVAYLLLGANNTVVPLLLMRGFNLPLEIIGRFVATGALGGVIVWIALARLVPRNQGPTRYYLLGFGLLAACGISLSRLSESAEPVIALLPALLCNGAFVIAVLSTTAVQTFRDLQRDETVFSHANQVKNMLAQFGVAAGITLATLFMQWRTTFHYVRLGESVTSSSVPLQEFIGGLAQRFSSTQEPVVALRMAVATVNGLLSQEATFMAALDYFRGVAVVAGICMFVAVLERWGRYLRARAGAPESP